MESQLKQLNDWQVKNPALRFLMPFQPNNYNHVTVLQRGEVSIMVYQDTDSEEYLVTYVPKEASDAAGPAQEAYYYCNTYAEVIEFLDTEFGESDKRLNYLAMSA